MMSDVEATTTFDFGVDPAYFAAHDATHTAAEIAQQPRLWRELAAQLEDDRARIAAFMARVGDLKKRRIILTGAGSSAFIGDAVAPLLAHESGIRAESIPTTELVSAPDSFLFKEVPTLLVSFARSGNSPESTGAVEYARSMVDDLYEIAITCDGSAKLAEITRQSQNSLLLVMPEGSNDKGFAMTSSVSCMLLAAFSIFNIDKIDDIAQGIDALADAVTASAPAFSAAAQRLAARDFDRVAYLGSGFLKHIAHEAELKMMELTDGIVNGTYESATGFRHGPKSVIQDKVMTVHLISPDPFTARYDRDLLAEVARERKNNIVVTISEVSAAPIEGDEIVAVDAGCSATGGDMYAGLAMLVFAQMLALFTSIDLGIPTDDPSPSGEVNRVVQGVTVYDCPAQG
jgi:tagatose-6-phosphate ketose/aldose isomerase